jgi:hypothetical protein
VERLLVAGSGIPQRDDIPGPYDAAVEIGHGDIQRGRGHDQDMTNVNRTPNDPRTVPGQFRAPAKHVVARGRRVLDDVHPDRVRKRWQERRRDLAGCRGVPGRQQVQDGLSRAGLGVVHPLPDAPGLVRPPAGGEQRRGVGRQRARHVLAVAEHEDRSAVRYVEGEDQRRAGGTGGRDERPQAAVEHTGDAARHERARGGIELRAGLDEHRARPVHQPDPAPGAARQPSDRGGETIPAPAQLVHRQHVVCALRRSGG